MQSAHQQHTTTAHSQKTLWALQACLLGARLLLLLLLGGCITRRQRLQRCQLAMHSWRGLAAACRWQQQQQQQTTTTATRCLMHAVTPPSLWTLMKHLLMEQQQQGMVVLAA
jgi:hypothetical protein